MRDKLKLGSPEYEKARARWTQIRTDWERVDAEYFRIHTEEARAVEEHHKRRMEREAAYNAASDALDELINADTNRRKELEEAFVKADAEREVASIGWEAAKATFNKARAEYERAIAEWEQVRANWQTSRDALDEFNRAGK